MPDVNIQPADEKMPELPLGMKMEDTAEIPDDFEEQVAAGNLERDEVGHVFKGGKEINPGQGKNRDIDIKIHHYFNDAAMTELMRQLDVEPKEQQNVIRRYVKQIVEGILPYIECPDDVGALINLDFPTNVRGLKNQIRNLISTMREATSDSDREILEMLDDEESEEDLLEIYKASVVRVRKDVIKLLNEELKDKGLKKEIYVSGDYHGHGGMGTVFSCHVGEADVAIKFLHKKKKKHLDKAGEKDLITATLAHPNLVDYYGHLIAEVEGSNQDVEFYEELKGAKSVTDHIRQSGMIDKKHFTESFIGFLEQVFLPALTAIKGLHSEGLVHRDIKLDNFFIAPSRDGFDIKVGDYDLVCRDGYDAKQSEDIHGTISHMSPEQWNWGIITHKSDIFSLGMTMYYLLGGKMPRNLSEAMSRGRYGDVDTSELHATPEMRDLVGRCLRKNPEERPDISELTDEVSNIIKGTKQSNNKNRLCEYCHEEEP